ncbi:MAG: hypothetical protein R2991_02645 [Thermoanaerobaculia bacterium]
MALRRMRGRGPLSELLGTVGSEAGRRRVRVYLERRPFPHYETAPGDRGLLIRIESDGTRTVGRFVDRRFEPVG